MHWRANPGHRQLRARRGGPQRRYDLLGRGPRVDLPLHRIRERRHAPPHIATSHMAIEAATLPGQGGVSAADVDLLVVGTFTPDMLVPSTACLVQDVGLNAAAMDEAACAGFIRTCHRHELRSRWRQPLGRLSGADCNTRIVNRGDIKIYPLWRRAAVLPGAWLAGTRTCLLHARRRWQWSRAAVSSHGRPHLRRASRR